jgi:release factor glutamine methyltransferase
VRSTSSFVPEGTVGAALAGATDSLRAAGSETPRLDAELLLANVLGIDRTGVLAHPNAGLGPGQRDAFGAAVARRATGEPVAYIRGLKEFYGLALSVDPRALIPRPETELLVELGVARAAEILSGRAWRPERGRLRVVDVGTGSGAVAIALLATLRRRGFGEWLEVLATDASPEALGLARENAVAHGLAEALRFREADLLPDDEPPFDLVLANLPYIPSEEIVRLPVAASFEPRAALDGGSDGLAVVTRLVDALPSRTSDLGTALFEIAPSQRDGLAAIADRTLSGWSLSFHDDLAGRVRVAELARRPAHEGRE